IAKSHNHGTTWTVSQNANPGTRVDKPHLCVDNNQHSPGNGNLYLGWMSGRTSGYKAQIERSTNEGASWDIDNMKTISNGASDIQTVNNFTHDVADHGICIRTGPNGEVYACWGAFDHYDPGSSL